MSEIKQISNLDESVKQSQENNRFAICEEVVDVLVEQGLPNTFDPSSYISKIANAYGLSHQEARTCLKLAIKQLETDSDVLEKSEQKEEKLYGQSGYFYPSASSYKPLMQKNDGMDSLSSLGCYNQLMFGLKN